MMNKILHLAELLLLLSTQDALHKATRLVKKFCGFLFYIKKNLILALSKLVKCLEKLITILTNKHRVMKDTLKLSPQACYKASQQGKEYAMAYIFTKRLSSLTKHPILLNFNTNKTAIRLLSGYTDKRFRQLLNVALTYRLAYYEGKHLRLRSKSQDRKEFKARHYTDVKHADAISFYHISVLKNNVTQQKRAIRYKSATTIKGRSFSVDLNPSAQLSINKEVTLSIRKVAQLLDTSISYAYALTKKLKGFGLRLQSNRQSITKEQYKSIRSSGKHNARYNKKTDECYYLKANTVTFEPFYAIIRENIKGGGYSTGILYH